VLRAPRSIDESGERRILRRGEVADMVAARRAGQGGDRRRAAGAVQGQPRRHERRWIRRSGGRLNRPCRPPRRGHNVEPIKPIMTHVNWYWIALEATVVPIVALAADYPFWRKGGAIFGNI